MENLKYKIVVRKIKNPRLEFKNGQLFIIVPNQNKFNIAAFIDRHKNWIAKQLVFQETLSQKSSSLALEPKLFSEFSKLVENFVNSYGKELGVFPKELKFKTWSARWGSCSRSGVVILNLKLRYFTNELISYVVFHELIHLIVKAHNRKFYQLLKTNFPHYKVLDKELLVYNQALKKLKSL